MGMREPVTFLKQTIKTFRTTGAVAPSSPFLGRAMIKRLPPPHAIPKDFRLLEVGPGTGSITEVLAKELAGRGQVDLYEINPEFVRHLKERIAREACFAPMRNRIGVHLGDVRDLPRKPAFDMIISGLPFNNFTPDEVRSFLEHFMGLLKPQGTLSYFEYVAIRRLQAPFVGKERRQRLKGVSDVVEEYARKHQISSVIVPINFPPARVRHLQFEPCSTSRS